MENPIINAFTLFNVVGGVLAAPRGTSNHVSPDAGRPVNRSTTTERQPLLPSHRGNLASQPESRNSTAEHELWWQTLRARLEAGMQPLSGPYKAVEKAVSNALSVSNKALVATGKFVNRRFGFVVWHNLTCAFWLLMVFAIPIMICYDKQVGDKVYIGAFVGFVLSGYLSVTTHSF